VGRCVAQSLVWCGLYNATRSCSTELKNRGNDCRAGDCSGSKRASPQTHSLTYLTSFDCKTMRGDIHKSFLLPPMDFHRRVLCPLALPPVFWFIPFPSTAFSSTSSTFSQAVCAAQRSGLARPAGAADLLRVCKLELKELSTSGNPREIYRRARFHE